MHEYKIRFWVGEWRTPDGESIAMCGDSRTAAVLADALREQGYTVLVMHYEQGGTIPHYAETHI